MYSQAESGGMIRVRWTDLQLQIEPKSRKRTAPVNHVPSREPSQLDLFLQIYFFLILLPSCRRQIEPREFV